jgi:predicted dithiol-disulfide oxidoreductase (DUF899 family)
MDSIRILSEIQRDVKRLEEEIQQKKKELAALRQSETPVQVKDYEFTDRDGKKVRLSELFVNHQELLVISNMGQSCRYCTLWADGFSGLTSHLQDRAGFVVVSPDPVEVQQNFATSRGWNFPMVSDQNSDFRYDMGFRDERHVQPGALVFTKDENNQIYLFSQCYFGPGDNFCVMWDLMDLMPLGSDNWEPQYKY